VGPCWLSRDFTGFILCRSALVRPAALLVRIDPYASTCPAPEPVVKPEPRSTEAYAWESNADSGLADYGISPVKSVDLYLSWRNKSGIEPPRVCPGTPLNISFPAVVERTRVDFQVDALQLADYRQENFPTGGFTGIGLPH
jgi:hypothetical protein